MTLKKPYKKTYKIDALDTLNAQMVKSRPRALRALATRPVLGAGNINAAIMFIGEAPGKQEDLQGVPFIGAAGKFLDQMLASIHLRRDDVYITNVVKYRPPNNRDPLPEEVEACWPWLQQEIAIIKPKLIILLGRHALARFIPGQKISEVHGKYFQYPIDGCGTQIIYALYHPAAALYNGTLRKTLLRDFARIPAILHTIDETV